MYTEAVGNLDEDEPHEQPPLVVKYLPAHHCGSNPLH